MSIKKQCWQPVYLVLQHNRDGSYATRMARRKILKQVTNELVDGGFQLRHIRSLKTKHLYFLVKSWRARELSAGTIKNRLTHLRWLAKLINISHIIPSNDGLGIPKRQYITNKDKSISLLDEQLEKITDPHVKLSLQLQRVFGLRREESIKLQPIFSDRGSCIYLASSWTKGGKVREVPIRNSEQRYWLNQAKAFVITCNDLHASLIPKHRSYVQQLEVYQKQLQRAGIQHAHGLRHAYTQQRFYELTGFQCPAKNGPTHQQLDANEKILDKEARMIISAELGHERESITAIYCGR